MSAFVVLIRNNTKDQAELDVYGALASKARDGHKLTPLAFYGELESLEGQEPEGAVIIKFDDIDAAKRWYYSPEYQTAKAHRNLGADYTVFILDGLD